MKASLDDLLWERRRRSVEQAQSLTFKAALAVIVSGALGALWLGIKAALSR